MAVTTDTTQKTGISRDNAASDYWRHLYKKNTGTSSRTNPGLLGFLKEEWHASGYFGSSKKRDKYPV